MKTLALSVLAHLACVAAQVSDLPVLDLPWGKWQAEVYEQDDQIYLFKNVRFGAEPERFGAPSWPTEEDDSLQIVDRDTRCIQIDITKLKRSPGGESPIVEPDNPHKLGSEDCLFLDIYVPARAFMPGAPQLPVVVWLYGGAYAFGAKDQGGQFYTGQSVLNASDYSTIFIAGNYRVGAFGWLAGHYMEEVGQPNAGLYDQALLFEWVQKYVSQVQGDKDQVSAWGESAGAGSILHHLIREDGARDPGFNTLVAQSPAFEWSWNNSADGRLDRMYQKFSEYADCDAKYNITCLREAPIEVLAKANQKLFEAVRQTGLFPVGPAVDGKWIKTIPTVAFSQGKFSKKIKSAMISHTGNEAGLFMPPVFDKPSFDDFMNEFLPGGSHQPLREEIEKKYCSKGRYKKCIETIIRDASFTCNTRDLFEAYSDKSYMMSYLFPVSGLAFHGADLVPLFSNSEEQSFEMLMKLLEIVKNEADRERMARLYAGQLERTVRKDYQKYLAAFAMSGDPNALETKTKWSLAKGGERLSRVMTVGALGFMPLGFDEQNKKAPCNFWTNIAKKTIEAGHKEDEDEEDGEDMEEDFHVQDPEAWIDL